MHPFDTLEKNITDVLETLEKQEQYETENKLDKNVRLRQISRETGEFLYQSLYHYGNLNKEPITGIEIGTSGGYSGIWQALGLQRIGKQNNKIISLENDPKKLEMATKNIKTCNLHSYIEIIDVDARKFFEKQKEIKKKFNYFFVDAEKEDYAYYYKMAKELAVKNSILYADNVISHKSELVEFLDLKTKDTDVITTIIPIGKGLAEVIFI